MVLIQSLEGAPQKISESVDWQSLSFKIGFDLFVGDTSDITMFMLSYQDTVLYIFCDFAWINDYASSILTVIFYSLTVVSFI